MSVPVPNAWLPTTHIGHACIFGTTAPFAFSRLAWFSPHLPEFPTWERSDFLSPAFQSGRVSSVRRGSQRSESLNGFG